MPMDPIEIDGEVLTPATPDMNYNPAYRIYALTPNEVFWRERAVFLRSHGYVMRRRYQPRWMPLWPNIGMESSEHEDCWQNLNGMVMDAFRIADESLAAIKCRPTNAVENELAIHRFLSSDSLRNDSANHCIPLLEVLDDPDCQLPSGNTGATFIITPFVYEFNQWPFQTIDNVLDFIRQTLEGIAFMHANGVAHRDCTASNVRIDASALFRGVWPHPVVPCMDYCEPFDPIPDPDRTKGAVRYHFIDFGEATRRPADHTGPFLVEGSRCIDQALPELKFGRPYDPFPVDVFLLGNMYKEYLLEVYNELDFLWPLVTAMTRQDPSQRPTIVEARRGFDEICASLAPSKGGVKLSRVDEPVIRAVARHVATAATNTFQFVRRLL